MNDRDRINALWLTLELTLNALEETGENVRVDGNDEPYGIYGESSRVRWNRDTKQWEAGAL